VSILGPLVEASDKIGQFARYKPCSNNGDRQNIVTPSPVYAIDTKCEVALLQKSSPFCATYIGNWERLMAYSVSLKIVNDGQPVVLSGVKVSF